MLHGNLWRLLYLLEKKQYNLKINANLDNLHNFMYICCIMLCKSKKPWEIKNIFGAELGHFHCPQGSDNFILGQNFHQGKLILKQARLMAYEK